MEYEHIDFPEALRMLADRAGVKLENQHFDSEAASKKELIYTLNRLSAEFYHYLLTKHKIGKSALEYLSQERKIKSATMETFLLGFAPKSGNALTTYLIKKKGYKADELIDAGLSYRRGQVAVDFFQGRIIFPLFDHRGNIVGFSGRIMREGDHPSKYVNTRETLVYHKGSTFFGMPTAKEEMKKSESVFLMEGEFDVISSFQEGIVNAVAVKGTALTPDQVTLLSRFVKRVALCFDMDRAGQDALKRSVPLLEKKGLVTSVVVFTQGKDADEAIKENVIGFKKAMKNPIGVYDFLLSQSLKANNPESADGKMRISQDVLPLFAEIENQIVREHYLQKLAQVLNTSPDAIEREIEKLKKSQV